MLEERRKAKSRYSHPPFSGIRSLSQRFKTSSFCKGLWISIPYYDVINDPIGLHKTHHVSYILLLWVFGILGRFQWSHIALSQWNNSTEEEKCPSCLGNILLSVGCFRPTMSSLMPWAPTQLSSLLENNHTAGLMNFLSFPSVTARQKTEELASDSDCDFFPNIFMLFLVSQLNIHIFFIIGRQERTVSLKTKNK